ncbi:hypothetical protein GCM10011533_35670 [Streptosporangium jomthongense]|nr:hypothetical protein GCM10011533_35670 [Streptosporangium jomthongense]
MGEHTLLLLSSSLLLGAKGEQILVFSGNVELFGNALGRFRHRIDAVLFLHLGVYEAPTDVGVFDFLIPREA